MIAKILSSTASFSGVNYNTDKVEQGKGELVNVSNFGALQMLSELRPTDYINYFKAVSSANKRVAKPQFHAVISAKGKSTVKEELTRIAHSWLSKMGYGKNPYLLVFHNDTKNNHIHAVSTRIDKAGKKISSAYEKLRAIKMLRETLDQSVSSDINLVTAKILKYNFSTIAQLKLLFELKGFQARTDNDYLKIVSADGQETKLPLTEVNKATSSHKGNQKRIGQVKQIIEKYKGKHSSTPVERESLHANKQAPINRYGSDLGDFLNAKFGIQLVFHYSSDHSPYGYTIIDHAEKNVFKGSEIMKLNTLVSENTNNQFTDSISDDNISETSKNTPISAFEEILNSDQSIINLPDLAEDIDDEAILGRNRQRKGMARTNTR